MKNENAAARMNAEANIGRSLMTVIHCNDKIDTINIRIIGRKRDIWEIIDRQNTCGETNPALEEMRKCEEDSLAEAKKEKETWENIRKYAREEVGKLIDLIPGDGSRTALRIAYMENVRAHQMGASEIYWAAREAGEDLKDPLGSVRAGIEYLAELLISDKMPKDGEMAMRALEAIWLI